VNFRHKGAEHPKSPKNNMMVSTLTRRDLRGGFLG
jgi:hypothetical protein